VSGISSTIDIIAWTIAGYRILKHRAKTMRKVSEAFCMKTVRLTFEGAEI